MMQLRDWSNSDLYDVAQTWSHTMSVGVGPTTNGNVNGSWWWMDYTKWHSGPSKIGRQAGFIF